MDAQDTEVWGHELELIAAAVCDGHGGFDPIEGPCKEANETAQDVLAALRDAGYTVAKLEQVGWRSTAGGLLHELLSTSMTATTRPDPVYRVLGDDAS